MFSDNKGTLYTLASATKNESLAGSMLPKLGHYCCSGIIVGVTLHCGRTQWAESKFTLMSDE